LTAALGCGSDGTAPAKLDGVVVIDGLRSKAPDEWVQERPAQDQTMRLAQFRLPGSGDDAATLIIFQGIGGTAKTNVERWRSQFTYTGGEPKIDVRSIGHLHAAILDVRGTFNESDMMNPRSPPQPRPGFRMVAVHLDGSNGSTYHIKLTGPEKTVDRYYKGFEEWLKGFE
jgi:gluconolactonase